MWKEARCEKERNKSLVHRRPRDRCYDKECGRETRCENKGNKSLAHTSSVPYVLSLGVIFAALTVFKVIREFLKSS
jgi:hypothetical protein